MRIRVIKDAVCGKAFIPAAEYWVSIHPEKGEFSLSSGGQDIHIKAIKRNPIGKGRITTIQFYTGGGRTWSLVASTPKQGEWVAFLEYQ